MTRIKEPPTGSDELPDYKSPPSRIVRSLRKGYDNLRSKVKEKSVINQALRGNVRDLMKSRDEWKERAKQAELELEKTSAKLKMLEEDQKKKVRIPK